MAKKKSLRAENYAQEREQSGAASARARSRLRDAPMVSGAVGEYEDLRGAKREQKAAREASARERTDPALEMRRQSRSAAAEYMASLRDSGVLRARTPQTGFQQMSMLHQAYSSNMVLTLLAPLSRGVGFTSIVGAIGTGAAMWAFSPQFRSAIGHYGQQISDGMGSFMKARREKVLGKKEAKWQEKLDMADPDATTSFKARLFRAGTPEALQDMLSRRWAANLTKVQDEQNGVPFTPYSAALTHVGLVESAYGDMRREGADPAQIKARLDDAVGRLYTKLVDDSIGDDELEGLSREEAQQLRAERSAYVTGQAAAEQRRIVAERMRHEPGFSAVFDETGHGAVGPAEPTLLRDPRTGEERLDEHGWESVQGERVLDGAFTVRLPGTWEDHQDNFTGVVLRDMIDEAGPDAMDKVFRGYAWGVNVQRMEEVDPSQADSHEDAKRIIRIKGFFEAMRDDGFSDEDAKHMYMGAVTRAGELLAGQDPVLSAQWAERYGEHWREQWADKESGFGAYFDEFERARAQEQQAAAAEHAERARAAFADGEKRFAKHSVPDGRGNIDEWYEDTKGNRVAFDAESASWLPEEEAARREEQREERAEAGRSDHPVHEEGEAPAPADGRSQQDVDDSIFGYDEEDIVDAEIVEDAPELDDAPLVDPSEHFTTRFDAPDLSGLSRDEQKVVLVDAMSAAMARDIVSPSVIGSGGGVEGSVSAMHVYSSSGRCLNGQSPFGADAAANRRALVVQRMARAVGDAGFEPAERDAMLATAYVQGLESAETASPALGEVLKDRRSGESTSDDWREREYELAGSRTEAGFPANNYERRQTELDEAAAASGSAKPEALQAKQRRARLARFRASKLNRVHINQGSYIMSNDRTLLDRMRDGGNDSPDVNDPGQTRLG